MSTTSKPHIVFSRPCTCRIDEHAYHEIDCEAASCGKHLKKTWEYLQNEKVDIFVGGRFSEKIAFWRGLRSFYSRLPYKMILLDNEWHCRYRNERTLSKICRKNASIIQRRIIVRGASYCQVFTEAERDVYADFYGIDRKKLVFIPYCSQLDASIYHPQKGNYLFTGGLNDRDYPTFFNAIRGLPVQIRIAAPKEHFANYIIPENVVLLGKVPKEEYFTQLAQSKAVVLPLEYSSLRYPGIITYVEAMRLGKAVIVNDPIGAKDYITNRESGLLVPNRDVQALREAIVELLDDAALLENLERKGLEHSHKNLGYDRYFRDIDALIEKVLSEP